MVKSIIKTINIVLPPLHNGRTQNSLGLGGQREVAASPARFKVVMCGRRWGKTNYGAWKCVTISIDGGRAWWVAPSYKIAQEGWNVIKQLTRNIPQVEIRESDRQVILPNGGMVEVRSSDIEGSLRGAGLDYVVIDEAAYHRESVWMEELLPALIDKRGGASFIGTPNGVNWFTRLYDRGLKLNDSTWSSWKKNTWDNPLISDEERLVIEAEYIGQPTRYQQEIEANIGASQFNVYPDFDRNLHMWQWALPKFTAFYGALDFAGDTIGAHKSAGCVAGLVEPDILLFLSEFEESGPNIAERQFEWVAQQEHMVRQLQKQRLTRVDYIRWKGDKSERLGLQFARSFGLSISPTKGGPDSISNGIHLVQRRLPIRGDGKARLYYLPQLVKFPNSMERYRYPELREGEVEQKQNPLAVNDDLVTTIRYICEAVDQSVLGDPATIYAGVVPRMEQ